MDINIRHHIINNFKGDDIIEIIRKRVRRGLEEKD